MSWEGNVPEVGVATTDPAVRLVGSARREVARPVVGALLKTGEPREKTLHKVCVCVFLLSTHGTARYADGDTDPLGRPKA